MKTMVGTLQESLLTFMPPLITRTRWAVYQVISHVTGINSQSLLWQESEKKILNKGGEWLLFIDSLYTSFKNPKRKGACMVSDV